MNTVNFRKIFVLSLILLTLAGIVGVMEFCRPTGSENKSDPGTKAALPEYAGDQVCRSCHATEYHDWLQSDHYKAMLPATDSTVLGDFNNAMLQADGVTTRFFRKGQTFIIQTEGSGGKSQEFEVKYIFGHYPLQQYLVSFPGGRMQVPRVSWDVIKKKWFHQYAGQHIPYSDWLHWTNGGQNWNTMCASCHSTNLQKNYLAEADSFHTTWSVVNVSCETCHGPAGRHVELAKGGSYKKGQSETGFILPASQGNLQQVNSCAPCHARKADISANWMHTSEIMDNLIPEIPSTENFHEDGQVDDEDYIYTSFLQSKMFHREVKCTHCHDPHKGELKLPVPQVCLQCHEKKYDSFEHHRHPAQASQVTCVDCHMPGKFYMGNDYRHDHSFRVPRPDLAVRYGTPNACNNCHSGKSAAWAFEAIVKWYGSARKYHFAEDLVPGSRGGRQAESHLAKLLGDTAVPAIVKATAAAYLGNNPTPTGLKLLLDCLRHADAQVRYRAIRSLDGFSFTLYRDAALPLLQDKVRAVRIAAADLFLAVPPEQVPAEYKPALQAARQELDAYIHYQADFAVGNVMIADYYMKQQNHSLAEIYYKRGLKKDSLMNYARFNLAALYNTIGKNDLALQTLQTALKTDPGSDRVHYNLALLSSEMRDMDKAGFHFKEAIRLGTEDPRVYYNYGVMLQQKGELQSAEKVLLKGIEKAPGDISLNYALAYYYILKKEPSKALVYAMVLKQADPENPDYSPLFQNLGLK